MMASDPFMNMIEKVVDEGMQYVLTRDGEPAVVIIGYDVYQALVATLDLTDFAPAVADVPSEGLK